MSELSLGEIPQSCGASSGGYMTEAFVLSESPEVVDLLVWCDYLEYAGENVDELRRLVMEGKHPRKDTGYGDIPPGYVWRELSETLQIWWTEDYDVVGAVARRLRNSLEETKENCTALVWWTYETEKQAWEALWEALIT